MEVIVVLLAASLTVAGVFLGVFIWATRSGQYEDTTTPALRILADDPAPRVDSPPLSSASLPTKKNP